MTCFAVKEWDGRRDEAAALDLLASAEGGALSGGDGICESLAMLAADTRGWGKVAWSAAWCDEGTGSVALTGDCWTGPGMLDMRMLF